MIPLNILIVLFIFIKIFIIGFIMTAVVLVNSIKEKNLISTIISAAIILCYIVFGLFLLL